MPFDFINIWSLQLRSVRVFTRWGMNTVAILLVLIQLDIHSKLSLFTNTFLSSTTIGFRTYYWQNSLLLCCRRYVTKWIYWWKIKSNLIRSLGYASMSFHSSSGVNIHPLKLFILKRKNVFQKLCQKKNFDLEDLTLFSAWLRLFVLC